MNAFLLFFFLFMLITLIARPMLKKEVTSPDCPNDVKAVKNNKLYFNIFFWLSVVLVVVGLILIIV